MKFAELTKPTSDKSLHLALQLAGGYLGFCQSNACSPTLTGFKYHSQAALRDRYPTMHRINETESQFSMRILPPAWKATSAVAAKCQFSGSPDHRGGGKPPGGGGGAGSGSSGGGGGGGGSASNAAACKDIPTPRGPEGAAAPLPEPAPGGLTEYIPPATISSDIS